MNNMNLPLVSIGLPVYNGERYLRQALESLLAQDYGNFELIISDNASTDSTFTICQEYQAKDKRIGLYRNDINVGMAVNFNKVFHLSSGEYFMWASHDDLWHKSYISKCVSRLKENPSAVMCASDAYFIDEFGKTVGGQTILETAGMDVVQRMHTLLSHFAVCQFYGVIRSEYLRKTNLVQPKNCPDIILLMELMLLGPVVKVPGALFYYRGAVRKHHTGLMRDMLQAVLKSNLPDAAKHQIQNDFVECLMSENLHWRQLIIKENFPESSAIDEANLRNVINSSIIG